MDKNIPNSASTRNSQATESFSANDAIAVTPSDTQDLANPNTPGIPARGLYVGQVGDVAVITNAGTTVTFAAVAAGTLLPVIVSRVLTTGTTAMSIVALY